MKQIQNKPFGKMWLCVLLCFLVLAAAACGSKTDAGSTRVTHLSASAKEIAQAVQNGADLQGAAFIASDETDAELTLMFSYGIESDEQLAAIDDYVLSTLTSNDYPYYFAVVRCKDGTDADTVKAIAETIRGAYPRSVIAQMAQYNGAWLSVAEGFTVQTYDNGIVVTAYDTDGNDTILTLVDQACRGHE